MTENTNELKIRGLIKNLLKKHGHSYKELAQALDLSEGAVKQLMTKGSFTIERLQIVAHWFGLSLYEFMQMALSAQSKPHRLSLEQEEILLGFPISIWLLFLLGSGFSVKAAKHRMAIEDKKFYKALFTLEKAELVEVLEGDRIRLKSRAPYRFNKEGEVERRLRKKYIDLVKQQVQFNPPIDTVQRTFEMYVSNDLYKKIQLDVTELLNKYAHLARIETEMDHKDKVFPLTGLFMLKPFDGWGMVLSKEE